MHCGLTWSKYCSEKNRKLAYIVYFGIICGLWSIIATRFHYSIDVIIALFLTFAIWQRYHIFADYKQLYYQQDLIIKMIETGDYTYLLGKELKKKKDKFSRSQSPSSTSTSPASSSPSSLPIKHAHSASSLFDKKNN